MADGRAFPVERSSWQPVKNVGREDIPPFGCMTIDGAELRGTQLVLKVRPCQVLGWTPRVLVNGPAVIKQQGYGEGTDSLIVAVAFHQGAETPEKGQHWGPVEESGAIRQHVPGARVLYVLEGDQNDKLVVVQRLRSFWLYAKLIEDLGPGESKTATLQRYNPNLSQDDRLEAVQHDATDVTLEIRDFVGEYSISSGKKALCQWDDEIGEWVALGYIC